MTQRRAGSVLHDASCALLWLVTCWSLAASFGCAAHVDRYLDDRVLVTCCGLTVEAAERRLRLKYERKRVIEEPPMICRGVMYWVGPMRTLRLFTPREEGERLFLPRLACEYEDMKRLRVCGVVRIIDDDVFWYGDVPVQYTLPTAKDYEQGHGKD